ncbi:MAG: C1 family peptidase [Bacteroidales bacterium]
MNIKSTLLVATAMLFTGGIYAQTIGETQLKEIQKSFVKDAQTTALQNLLTNDKDIKSKTLNRDLQGKIDHFFKYRADVKGITNQYGSGRCWMFTSMNALRPGAMKKYNLSDFDFSHNYNYFWDIFEKSNLFLENMIATAGKDMDDREVATFFSSPIGDGGVWNLFYNVAEKYGVVPQSVMPETEHSNNTSGMLGVLNECLRKGGYDLRQMAAAGKKAPELSGEKMNILKDVYRVLALCLGEPPTEFTWRYKTEDGEVKTLASTPKEFYASIKPADYAPSNYIMIMNDPTREYYKVYEIKNYRNTLEGINWIYLNLPNEEIKPAALASIKNNEPLYGSCDVGKQNNSKEGIADPNMYNSQLLLGISGGMDKKARILTRQSGSSHAMLIMACDTDENDNPVKWQFENSWGASAGHNGYLTFTDKWFDEYMFRVVINKNYLSPKAQKAATEKPVLLPVWDYMF